MSTDHADSLNSRPLETLFKEHLDIAVESAQALSQLFSNLEDPEPYIAKVKQLEEKGDRLTAEAYDALEVLGYSDFIYSTEQLVKRLDDIVDGINNTARMIDICHPRKIETAAHDLLSILLSMIASLQVEIAKYPENELASLKTCREALKKCEESADVIYHDWRKKQHRILVLPLVDESNWTEILGILEQTSDSVYHAAVLLERLARYRSRR
jgi:uncharacterized protein Yka (UPF0111/DUF47 family)